MTDTPRARINPSVLNCDFMRIGAELERIAAADRAHIDIMDGHFVPNISFGPSMVEQMAEASPIGLDVHLMIDDPDREAVTYAEAGAESVTFHLEASAAPIRLARELHRAGVQVGVALRPATPVDSLLDILGEFDMVLAMTVEPGFGGQSFLPSMMPKVARLREAISAAHLELAVQVDGGVNRESIAQAAEAGADVFVAGSAIYRAEDAAAEIAALREIADSHLCGHRGA